MGYVFRDDGYFVDIFFDGQEGLDFFKIEDVLDLIILDINLLLVDGFLFILMFCKGGLNILCICLFVLGEIDDWIVGFDVGGDDYLVKFFEMVELKVCIRVFMW